MKLHQKASPILFLGIVFILGILLGKALYKKDFSCAQMGADFLSYGKEKYGISPNDEVKWSQLVDLETRLVNLCYETPTDHYALGSWYREHSQIVFE